MSVAQEKILVSDFHIGCGLAQTSTLKALSAGTNTASPKLPTRLLPRLLSFSGHVGAAKVDTSYLSKDEKTVVSWVKRLFNVRTPLEMAARRAFGWSPKCNALFRLLNKVTRVLHRKYPTSGWAGKTWTRTKSLALLEQIGEKTAAAVFARHDTYLVSFPPSLARLFLDLAERYDKRLILNLGHRFNIGIYTKKENDSMIRLLEYIHRHPRHILAAGSEYDVQYVRYYLGIEPEKLPLCCFHVEAAVRSPKSNVILVGPGASPKGTVDRLNAKARNSTGKAMQFANIKEVYPHYDLEDLANHPAVVIFPYSAFSMRMLELYELNVPFFVPNPDLLLEYKTMYDRALFPVYCTEKQCARMNEGQVWPNLSGGVPSPNSYENTAQKYWFQFCFFYRTKNAIIWDSEEDLLEKLANTDLEQVRREMYKENQERREAALRQWRSAVFPGKNQ